MHGIAAEHPVAGGAGVAESHVVALDGWRGISILLVLAAHLLPLGPKALRLNELAGTLGMAIFFTLSGFLIVSMLLRDDSVVAFLIRRAARIVPLAWLFCTVIFMWKDADAATRMAHYLFYGNLPPFWLTEATAHLWSLAVEAQFYVAIALIVLVLGQRGLLLVPLLAVAVTAWRVHTGETLSIVTWLRVDEILAGGTLALLLGGKFGPTARKVLLLAPLWVLVPIVAASCHGLGGPVQYIRPYAVAALVGVTAFGAHQGIARALSTKFLGYIARVSYALYVIHAGLGATWLGEGDKVVKYLKRPLLFAVLFVLAHLSTFHFEARFISAGRLLAARWKQRRTQGAQS
jgi:peptidoglycan/LPS O-acetylase OafA/YrhL